MEPMTNWLRNWSNACAYAKECWPDLSAFDPGDPYFALAGIAVGCYVMWAFNEWRIRRPRGVAFAAAAAASQRLSSMVERMNADPQEKKLAA